MIPKKLNYDDYLKYFQFNRPESGCGVETERETWEKFLFLQIFLPKDYFYVNRFVHQSIPSEVHIKFELFGIGEIGKRKCFVFKPWVINIDDPFIYNQLENFHLFIPDYLFFNLIERLIFMEEFSWEDLNNLRVLEDLSEAEFEQFGLNKIDTPKHITTERLRVSRIYNLNTIQIKEFYENNWEGLNSNLEHKYFRPKYNIWFKIEDLKTKEEIGYLRLYNSNSSFTGGTSIEYIITKKKQGHGFATEATRGMINYLKRFSFAHNLGAEVNDNNKGSINVLKKCGFIESHSDNWVIKDNYFLSLVDSIDKELESQIQKQDVEFSIQNTYAERYNRYF